MYQWLEVGDTNLLMQLQTHGERQEWHPVAQVTLRQIYASVRPMYHAWRITDMETIGRYEDLAEAKERTERVVESAR